MPIQISIDTKDSLGEQLKTLPKKLQRAALDVMGRSGSNVIREHLSQKNLEPNKNGWPKTNFYGQAARAVTHNVSGKVVNIDITGPVGIRQRYQGGVIKPKHVKFLTMPAAPEAYGKRAGEFNNLVFAIVTDANGRKRPALVEAEATKFNLGRRKKDGSRSVKVLGETGGGVFYWLIRSANQAADPTVLPARELISTAIERDTKDFIQTTINQSNQGGTIA